MVPVLDRITHYRNQKGWSEYQLATESGLTQSTISSWYRKKLLPSIPSLEKICNAFGITLSQFFAEGEMVELTPELKELFDNWVNLTPQQKDAVLQTMRAMNHDQT